MRFEEYVQRVATILSDPSYVFLHKDSYEEAVRTAFYEYNTYYPNQSRFEITVDSTQGGQEYNLRTLLPNWQPRFSIIQGVEVKQASGVTQQFLIRGIYIRTNYFDLFEDDLTGEVVLRILFGWKGTLRLYYTYPLSTIEEVGALDQQGLLYLACHYACLSCAAKASQLVENYIGAERTIYERRAKNYMELAQKYRQQAYSLLDIPPEGLRPYSAVYFVPYIERRRSMRRTI